MRRKMPKRLGWIAVLLIAFMAAFYRLPYYVSTPGSAEQLEPFVNVEGGHKAEGSFMLTTVRMGQANIYSYLWAHMAKYQKIYKVNEVRQPHETDEEYAVRQMKLMNDSQLSAILNAYKLAGEEVHIEVEGIYVLHVVEDKPADGVLKPGDRVLKVDQKPIHSQEFFMDYVASKKEGESIELEIKRGSKKWTESIKLEMLKEANRPGIGITLVEDRGIQSNPPVKIEAEKIGGPSAGLMFTLEIYNQLTEADLTHGKKIAGTGTIADDGSIGPIGGIDQKVVAADKEGAVLFFAPNEEGAENSDYKIALQTAKEIGTDMKIVPVDKVEDAVSYLESMGK